MGSHFAASAERVLAWAFATLVLGSAVRHACAVGTPAGSAPWAALPRQSTSTACCAFATAAPRSFSFAMQRCIAIGAGGSLSQVALQPSSLTVLPSSHSSPAAS